MELREDISTFRVNGIGGLLSGRNELVVAKRRFERGAELGVLNPGNLGDDEGRAAFGASAVILNSSIARRAAKLGETDAHGTGDEPVLKG